MKPIRLSEDTFLSIGVVAIMIGFTVSTVVVWASMKSDIRELQKVAALHSDSITENSETVAIVRNRIIGNQENIQGEMSRFNDRMLSMEKLLSNMNGKLEILAGKSHNIVK